LVNNIDWLYLMHRICIAKEALKEKLSGCWRQMIQDALMKLKKRRNRIC
jgi:hypothetical protein